MTLTQNIKPDAYSVTYNGTTVGAALDRAGLNHTVAVSQFSGDLAAALSVGAARVVVDEDCILNSTCLLYSGVTVECINGAVITAQAGGSIETPVTFTSAYYSEASGNPQRAFTSNVYAGATSIPLSSVQGIQAGSLLILKNGYCDMWRVLESGDAELQRKAVNSGTFYSEQVKVLAVNSANNTVTVSPVKYNYPLVPTVYGYISQENALPQYSGFTRPSATPLLYKDIKLNLNLRIENGINKPVIELAYVDGVEFTGSISSSATLQKPVRFSGCVLDVHDVSINGHTGGVVWMQDTCVGACHDVVVTGWNAGHDSPLASMLLSEIHFSNINVTAAVKYTGTSACYINACRGGTISQVIGTNLARTADVSFSANVVVQGLVGYRCDFAAGAFASSNCIISDAVVSGYCLQTSSSSIYTSTLLQLQNNTNVTWSHIKRLNDLGYGRIRINGSIGCVIEDIQSDATVMHVVIGGISTEVAKGVNNTVVLAKDVKVAGLVRESTYYDASDEYGFSYPWCRFLNCQITGTTLELGGRCNPADIYDLYGAGATAVLGEGYFGVRLSGLLQGITLSSGKSTCFPDVSCLRLLQRPVEGVFNDVDAMVAAPGTVWSVVFMNGACISDVYSRRQYRNTKSKGLAPIWV